MTKKPTAGPSQKALDAKTELPGDPLPATSKRPAIVIPDKIERWAIGRVVAYAKNARLHSADQVAQIAKSIETYGFNNPCIVDADGVLVTGHGRILAAQRLGMVEVPVIQVGHLSKDAVAAFRLADNKLALNWTWDKKLLAAELSSLQGMGVDLGGIGFSGADLGRLMDDGANDRLGELAGEGGDDEPSASSEPEQPPAEYFPFSVNLTKAERDDVFAGLKVAKAKYGIEHSGTALARVLRELSDAAA